ncbi:glutathione S-transferase family protein [Pseudomonas oryzicola]|uniref:Glutathione S-transferase n=1 Tax=Pseudomonas oryzicola TaxID=485876 RepID=A0ABS6Q811_9PSED|nr:glutathione S-transferase [Pseudomonas oryzicola]MBV4490280.1 glutathione S-transferase [Pseudomonas oryzicola]
MSNPIKLYNFPKSGHAHRIELMLSLLNLPTELVFVDLAKGAHKQPDFLALNPFGQVPVIDDNGTVIADSNAILVYLAKKYDNGTWLPEEPAAAARVQRWLSVAAGPLAFGPAAARLVTVFGASFNTDEVIARAHTLLKVMDAELAKAPFLAGNTPTIADIANYSYIAHAPEGNVSLEPYANVRNWLARIEALPGFVPMPRTVIGLQTSA